MDVRAHPRLTNLMRARTTYFYLRSRPVLIRFLLALLFVLAAAPRMRGDAKPAEAPARAPMAEAKALHLTVRLLPLADGVQPGGDLDVGLVFHLERGWHVYWVNAGDSGEPPTIKWNLPQGITASAMQFPAPKRLPLGPLMDFGYDGEVLFPMKLHADPGVKPGDITAGAKVSWLVCREQCVPGKAELALPLKITDQPTKADPVAQALFDIYRKKLPQPLPSGDQAKFVRTADGFTLAVLTGSKETSAQFFPLDQSVIANAAPQPVKMLRNGIELGLKKDENLPQAPGELHGVLVMGNGTAYEIHATPGTLPAATSVVDSVWTVARISGLAFLGGMILNLMPCVFPVLFIKGLALVQSSTEERRRMRLHGWIYTLGIVVSFWAVVGLLLALRAGGQQFGWGFQFQSPSFLAVMGLLLFFLGLSLAGLFEIGLTLTSAGSGLASRGGYVGSFFTGVLAMVVATPCTAPFMGVAIGYALNKPAGITFGIFTAIALGLAAPYLLLAYNPAWTRLLPRPGAWMEVLKQATSVPIFGTVIWLVWLFTQASGANALLGLLGGFLLLAIAGWILGRWPARGLASAVAALVIVGAIALPVWAAQKFGVAPATVSAASSAKAGDAEAWVPFTPDVVASLQAQGKPVFVDFTASWCLSCQVNERVVLDRADVRQRLKDSGVALVRADWTRHDEAIAQALAALGRSGVPTYALYSATPGESPQLLPEVLTPGIVMNALNGVQPRQAMK
jgi:thiol:disulfide interchange protein